MSFLIAITDGINSRIAADGQITKDGTEEYISDYKKIREYQGSNFPVYVGFAGDVVFAEKVFIKLSELPFTQTMLMNAYSYAYEIQRIVNEGITILGYDRDTFKILFFVVSKNYRIGERINTKPEILYVDSKTKKPVNIEIKNNTYTFINTGNNLKNNANLNEIIKKHLYSQNLSLDKKLENLIKEIADYDDTVNKNVYIYEF